MNLGALFSPVPLGARGPGEAESRVPERKERKGERLPRCRRGRVERRGSLGLGVRVSAVGLCSRRGRGVRGSE